MRRFVLLVVGAVVGVAFAMLVASAYARAVPQFDEDVSFDVEATPVFYDRFEHASGERFAPTADGSVWSIGQGKLALFVDDFRDGFSIDLRAAGAGEPKLLAVDPYDSSAWVVTSYGLLMKFDVDGRVERMANVSGSPTAATVALDQTLWIAVEGALRQFDRDGDLIIERRLNKTVVDEIAVDSLHDRLIAFSGEEVNIYGIRAERPDLVVAYDMGNTIHAAALDPITGDVWALESGRLLLHGADGAVSELALDDLLSGSDALAFDALAFDAGRDEFVVVSPHAVRRFDRRSRRQSDVDMSHSLPLAVPSPFRILPSIEVVKSSDPADFGIVLAFGARCNDHLCDVGAEYLSTFTLFASVDGIPVPARFSFDASTRRSSVRFEGLNASPPGIMRIHAMDRFGHVSEPVEVNVSNAQWTLGLKGNQTPTVSITSPINNATFIPGSTITLTATASDSDGTIAKVEFFRSGTLIGTATSAPYTVTWSKIAAGSYALTAKATDDKGGTKTSANVNIVVKVPPNVAPSIAITSPAANSTVSGPSVAIAFTATDSDGTVTKVDFFEGTNRIGTTTGGSATLNSTWTYVNPTSGVHTIKATATDNAGAITSATVAFTVNAAPWAVLTSPAPCSEVISPANVTLTADAYDGDGTIAHVEFYRGSTLLASVSSAPYRFVWISPPVGNYVLTAVAVDNLGATRSSNPVTFSVQLPDIPPTVSITSPLPGARFGSSAVIPIVTNAADSDGSIKKVEFYAGSTLLATASVAPFNANWTPPATGNYVLTAKATDNRGVSSMSAGVSISVVSNVLPTITLAMPLNGPVFVPPKTVDLVATASDTDGVVRKVEFLVGGEWETPVTLIGAVTSPPFTMPFTVAQAGGRYSVMARATDDLGGTRNSNIIKLYGNTPPKVTILSPAEGTMFLPGTPIVVVAQASDPETGTTNASADGYVDGKLVVQSHVFTHNLSSDQYTFRDVFIRPGSKVTLVVRVWDGNGVEAYSVPVHFETAPAPLLKLLTPLDGDAVIAPGPLKLTASASQPLGRIVRVDYYASGSLIGSSSIPPYTVNWSNVPYPGHSDYAWVWAEATDSLGTGGTAKSAYALVFLDGVRLAITSPADDADVRVPRVEIKGTYGGSTPSSIMVNGVSATFANGAFSAIVPLNLGGNRLEVVATSALGTTTKSVVVSYVKSTVRLTAPKQDDRHDAPATIHAAATTEYFDRSVKRVEFWSDDTKMATAFAEPWTAGFQVTKPGSHLIYAKAIDIEDTITLSYGVYVSINFGAGAFIVSPTDNSEFPEGVPIEITTYLNTSGANLSRAELLMDGRFVVELRPQSTSNITWTNKTFDVGLGEHTFVVRSTDTNGVTFESEPLRLSVKPGPTATLALPIPNSTFVSPASILLVPRIAKTPAEIQVVEFFANDLRVARSTDKPFTTTWSNVPDGTYDLSVRVTDVYNRSSQSSPIPIIVANSAVNLDMPEDDEVIYEPTVMVGGTFSPAGLATIQVNGVTSQTGSGTFAAMVPLNVGANVITVAANFGTYTTHRTIHITRAEPSIFFTNIANGDVVHDDSVTIRGFLRAPRNSGLLVNGLAVPVSTTGEFIANKVRLTASSNTIPFKLVKQDGLTVDWSLTGVTRDRIQPFVMQMTPTSGFTTPLRALLTLTRRSPADYTRVVISAGGQTILDEHVTASKDERVYDLQFKSFVSTEIRIQLFDAAQVEVFNGMMVARVTEPEALDSEIRYLYKSTINRMLAGDLIGASTAYLPHLQADYRALYEDLGPNVRELSDTLREVSEINFGDDSAEIVLKRQEANGVYGYPVGVMRDNNRIWRISGM